VEKRSNKVWVWVLVIVLVVVALGATGYALLSGTSEKKTTDTKTSEQAAKTETKNTYKNPDPLLPTIVFKDEGFTQAEYRFPAGTAIKVDNQSSMDMQFSSDDHPTHKDHSELNMKLLGPGESGTFTPPGKGTYGFHDHINDQFEGTLIIE